LYTETVLKRRMERVRSLLATKDDYADGTSYSRVFKDSSVIQHTGQEGLRFMSPKELDDSLEKLERDRLAREGVIDTGEKEAWEYRKESRNRSGDYASLEKLLGRIDPGDRDFLGLFHQGFIYRDHAAKEREKRLVRWLASEMSGPIKVPKGYLLQEHERLNIIVKHLASTGYKIKEVAREVGASQRLVRKLLSQK